MMMLKSEQIINRDLNCMSPSLTRPYLFVMDHGMGCTVVDVDGNKYLDMNAGIGVNLTGHCHPTVVKAIEEQSRKFLHYAGTDFYYEIQVELAEKLLSTLDSCGGGNVFFTNSGTEAVECAIKLSQYRRRGSKILAFIGAFHGRTLGSLGATCSKAVQRAGFNPVNDFIHVPFSNAGLAYLEDQVLYHLIDPQGIGAVLFETIQGEGGYVFPTQRFIDYIFDLSKRHDWLTIADEIQCGMGRTGSYWAIQDYGYTPSILLSAKGLASGLPLGACIARPNVMTWGPGSHGSTFGGNPIACASALATFKVIEEERLLERATELGDRILKGMPSGYNKRGKGLMLAIDLPSPSKRDRVVMELFNKKILVLPCGSVSIRITPPLVITKEEVDFFLSELNGVLT